MELGIIRAVTEGRPISKLISLLVIILAVAGAFKLFALVKAGKSVKDLFKNASASDLLLDDEIG